MNALSHSFETMVESFQDSFGWISSIHSIIGRLQDGSSLKHAGHRMHLDHMNQQFYVRHAFGMRSTRASRSKKRSHPRIALLSTSHFSRRVGICLILVGHKEKNDGGRSRIASKKLTTPILPLLIN